MPEQRDRGRGDMEELGAIRDLFSGKKGITRERLRPLTRVSSEGPRDDVRDAAGYTILI
jgi:hypothetical protein